MMMPRVRLLQQLVSVLLLLQHQVRHTYAAVHMAAAAQPPSSSYYDVVIFGGTSTGVMARPAEMPRPALCSAL